MRRRDKNKKKKIQVVFWPPHACHDRCSIGTHVHTKTHTHLHRSKTIFYYSCVIIFFKNELLKYTEQAHFRKDNLLCSYFSVHLGHSSFQVPGLWDSKTADLCGHLSTDGPARGTISHTLLCPTQKALDTWRYPATDHKLKQEPAAFHSAWTWCSQKAATLKKSSLTFVLWERHNSQGSHVLSKTQLPRWFWKYPSSLFFQFLITVRFGMTSPTPAPTSPAYLPLII